jgi:hypothetical protein
MISPKSLPVLYYPVAKDQCANECRQPNRYMLTRSTLPDIINLTICNHFIRCLTAASSSNLSDVTGYLPEVP